MKKRFFHLALTLLFACLQGVAPLAHAHVGGGNVDQRIHLDGLQSLPDHTSSLKISSIEKQHSPAVSMPQEHQGSQDRDISLAPLHQFHTAAPSPVVRVLPLASQPAWLSAFPLRPHPQAPPAI